MMAGIRNPARVCLVVVVVPDDFRYLAQRRADIMYSGNKRLRLMDWLRYDQRAVCHPEDHPHSGQLTGVSLEREKNFCAVDHFSPPFAPDASLLFPATMR